jgi:hypothetical protein
VPGPRRPGIETLALDGVRQQPDGVERLDRLTDSALDLLGRDALREQLSCAAVARAGGERGGDEVPVPARPTNVRACPPLSSESASTSKKMSAAGRPN